jgi:hypothetical protein
MESASGIDIWGHNGVAVGDFDGDGFDVCILPTRRPAEPSLPQSR